MPLTRIQRAYRSLLAVLIVCGFVAACQSQAAAEPRIATQVETETLPPPIVKIAAQPTVLPSSLPSPTLSPTAIETAGQNPEPTAATPTTPLLPEEHYILTFSGHKQFFPLGCETSVAVDWAAYFGVEITEYNFQYELPKSDNPELGFVGDVRSPWGQVPPYAYGVHAAPVADLLQKYGLPARAVKQMTLEEVKAELASDQPIIAWVIGNMVGGIPADYIDQQGNKVVVAAYEHVVVLTGYNNTSIRYNNNGRFYEVPYDVFLNSWGVLENMALIMDDTD